MSLSPAEVEIMELNETVRRIGGQHWRLIVACVVLAAAASAVVAGGTHTYTASARLVLDTQDPQSRPASVAIADTAKAIATSPAQVQAALTAAGVRGRDATDVARHHVAVQALGASAILQLSVTDRDSEFAARIANALARRVIQTRLAVSKGQVTQTISALDSRIDDLTRQISDADAYIDSLAVKAATAGSGAVALQAKRDNAIRARGYLTQRRAVIESERDSLLSADALRPNPSIISPATVPLAPDASHRLQGLVIGALLGLVLGIGLAGLIETFRPTLIGPDVLAREFGAPHLGTLRAEPDAASTDAGTAAIALRIRLAADAGGLRSVGILTAGPPVGVAQLAERLNGLHAPGRQVSDGGPSDLPGQSVRISPFGFESASMSARNGLGLIVVAPTMLKLADVGEATHLVRAAAAPLVGVITYKPSRTGRRKWLGRGTARLRGAALDAVTGARARLGEKLGRERSVLSKRRDVAPRRPRRSEG
jgi:capsular polysaccharide biosynthesis protein